MRILVACECSGVVRRAFRALGHDAWSCDILPAEDSQQYHIQGDALAAIYALRWDMLIGHPPCDYLTNSAAWAFKDPDFTRYPGVGYHQKVKPGTLTGEARRKARISASAFFRSLWGCGIERICIENPIGYMNTAFSVRPQIIQPYRYGADASKATCLWLRGLPPLRPTGRIHGRVVEWPKGSGRMVERWANQTDSGQNRLSPSDDRASVRAVTYQGIADAMADQWGGINSSVAQEQSGGFLSRDARPEVVANVTGKVCASQGPEGSRCDSALRHSLNSR